MLYLIYSGVTTSTHAITAEHAHQLHPQIYSGMFWLYASTLHHYIYTNPLSKLILISFLGHTWEEKPNFL